MVESSHLYALFAAVLWSLAAILYRWLLPRGVSPLTLMLVGQLGAVLLIAVFFGAPDLFQLDSLVFSLLVASGLCWALGVYLEIRALEHIEASAVGVIGALRYVLTLLIAVYYFDEEFTRWRILGAGMIVVAIIGMSDLSDASLRKGFLLQLSAVVPNALANGLDKYLSNQVAVSTIAISAFLFPGLVSLMFLPKKFQHVVSQVRSHALYLFIVPILLGSCYYATVKAFSIGELTATMAIAESSLILIWILGFVLLKERTRPLRSFLCCCVCAAGVVLVCGKN